MHDRGARGARRAHHPRLHLEQLRARSDIRDARLREGRRADRPGDVRRVPPGRRDRAVCLPYRARPREPRGTRRRGSGGSPHAAVAAERRVAALRRSGSSNARHQGARDARPVGQVTARAAGRRTPRHSRRDRPRRDHCSSCRRVPARARDGDALPAFGGPGRNRRLPLLPPRPQARGRPVRHVGADRAGRRVARPPRDPLPDRAGIGRRGYVARPSGARGRMDMLRRPGGGSGDGESARVPRRRGLDRRMGAGVGRRPTSRRHRHLASGRQPDRDAGPLQPPERNTAGSFPRRPDHGAREPRLDAAPDGSPPGAGRARVSARRERGVVRSDGRRVRSGKAVRERSGARADRPAASLRQGRGAADRPTDDLVRPTTSRRRRRSTPSRVTCICSDGRFASS